MSWERLVATLRSGCEYSPETKACSETRWRAAKVIEGLLAEIEGLRQDAERERLARRVVDQTLHQLQADYTEAVRLYRERDAQAARYHDRLQIDPGGSDRIDELEAAIAHLRHELNQRG